MPEPPRISAITTCKDRLAHLQQTLPRLVGEPFHEVVVVDFDCPDRAGDWVAATYPTVKVVRVAETPIFHLARARNLGAAATSGSEWLFFTDVDTKIEPGFLGEMASRLAPGGFYLAEPLAYELYGTIFMTRADYERVGGYDEAIQGWGSEDEDIVEQLETIGRERRSYDARWVSALAHDNESRTRHHRIKDHAANNAVNFIYRAIKRDLGRQGLTLKLAARQNIHAQITAAYLARGATPRSVELVFDQFQAFEARVTKALRYTIDVPAAPS